MTIFKRQDLILRRKYHGDLGAEFVNLLPPQCTSHSSRVFFRVSCENVWILMSLPNIWQKQTLAQFQLVSKPAQSEKPL